MVRFSCVCCVCISDGRTHRDGVVATHAQPRLPKSRYQRLLDEEEQHYQDPENFRGPDFVVSEFSQDIKYWSDFSRVYYSQRNLQILDEDASRQDDGSWLSGQEMFQRYDDASMKALLLSLANFSLRNHLSWTGTSVQCWKSVMASRYVYIITDPGPPQTYAICRVSR
jgi:hypothetical protein